MSAPAKRNSEVLGSIPVSFHKHMNQNFDKLVCLEEGQTETNTNYYLI